jgi:GT2 family glycosyltransferase
VTWPGAYIVVVHRDDLSGVAKQTLGAAAEAGLITVVASNGGELPEIPRFVNGGLQLENRGYGAAINDAVDWIRLQFPAIEYVCFANDDILIPTDAFRDVAARMDTPDEAVAYGMESHFPQGGVYFCGGSVDWRTPRLSHWEAPQSDTLITGSEVLNGAVIALPLTVFLDVGGFDERFFLYFEDLDLSLRLRDLGVRLLLIRGHKVLHDGGASTADRPAVNRSAYVRSQILFANKWQGRRAALRVAVRVILRSGLGSLSFHSLSRRLRREKVRSAMSVLPLILRTRQ